MRWFQRIGWRIGAAMLVIVILAVRLAGIAWHTETGWETVADDCHAAVIGQFFGYRLPLSQRTPTEQTEFWIREINRVLAEEPVKPDVLEGALWVLNTQFEGYRRFPTAAFAEIPEIDAAQLSIRDLSKGLRTKSSSVEELFDKLVSMAAADFPDSRTVWQAIAFQAIAGQSNWQAILEQCRKHDPENALYEYLSAYQFFQDAYRAFRYPGGNALFDPDQRERRANEIWSVGLQHIQAGLKKPSFELPDERHSVITFLSRSALSASEQKRVSIATNSRDSQHSILMSTWNTFLNFPWSNSDVERQQALQRLPIAKPFSLQMLNLNILTPPTDWQKLVRDSYGAMAIVERSFFQHQTQMLAMINKFNAAQKKWNAQHRSPSRWNTWIGYIARTAAQFAVIMLILAGVAVAISRFLRTSQAAAILCRAPWLGVLRQSIAWILALALTTVLFGLAPAGVISQPVQSWVLTSLFLTLLTLLPLGVASWWGGRFSLRILMELVLFYAIVFGFLNYWNISTGALHEFPPEVRASPYQLGSTSSTKIQEGLRLAWNSPRWIALQWVLYDGPIWTIALALLTIGWWTLDRAKRVWKESAPKGAPVAVRRRWLAWVVSRSVARAAAGAAVVALMVFLALEPERIAHNEAIYLSDYQRVHDPDAYWGGLKQEQQKLIEEMRADVEQELSRTP